MIDRTLVTIVILIAVIIAAMFIVFSPQRAHGATCASRPGISQGKVWWRYRIDRRTGARCWYPGLRHAMRRTRPVALRTARVKARSVTAQPVEADTRTVRSLRLYNGFTASEHVQRRFDQLIVFPVEED
jgi:hypothetical protein